jgi:hypothetical protein
VYGYPREPEETGDEFPAADLPYRVSSEPVSVPGAPASPGSPPQPLLPPDPEARTYPSVADLIPMQRPASDSEPVMVPSGPAPNGVPPVGPTLDGVAPDDLDQSSGFDWLHPSPRPTAPPEWRAADQPSAPPAPALPDWRATDHSPGAPAPAPGAPAPAAPAPSGPALSTPVPRERPGFGPSPTMGQPAYGGPFGGDDPERATPDRTAIATSTDRDLAGGAPPPSLTPPAASTPSLTPPPVISLPPISVDEPGIPPWDRKPLLVVIASAVVLVLIGIISGVVTAAVASSPVASWRDAGSQPAPDPGATPGPEPTAAPAPAPETITLSGVGDVIMGSVNLGVPPNNGAGFFDPVREALAADLVMGNLDMALSDPTGYGKCSPGATDCFQLSLPPSYADVLRDGGFQLMTLANNHSQDQGPQGYANTQAALTSAGIEHTGGVDQITYITVKDVNVAVLGFSIYSYTANLNDIPRAVELVRQAAEQADLVVVQMQGGAEGSDRTRVPPAGQHESFAGEDRGDLRGFAYAVIDAGADIIFGHGPHVMRGMEFYQGRLIAYSLGNFCGYAVLSSSGWSGVGGILKVTLNRDGTWAGGQLVATEMVNGGSAALDGDLRALAFVDDLSVQDFGGGAARIDHATGAITAP